MTSKNQVAAEMRSIAATMKANAERIEQIAAHIAEAHPADFNEQVASQYAGPSWAIQMMNEVHEATTPRPGSMWAFQDAITKYIAAQQREAGKAEA